MVSWFHDLSLRALYETKKPVNMVSWYHDFSQSVDSGKPIGFNRFCGFMVSSTPSLDSEKLTGFVVSSTPYLDSKKPIAEMTIGFMVSRFRGFMVSSTPSLNSEKSTGFVQESHQWWGDLLRSVL